tara:strand:- start:168 stop:1052 length:885 start_codon:yes stop_codon:yes gene_type:complete
MASSSVTHFISPQVIDIDDIDAKVEAVLDFVPIRVHGVYMCDETLPLKLVNTSADQSFPTYRVQDFSGNDLNSNDVAGLINSRLPNMRHVYVADGSRDVTDNDISGARLSTINADLTQMLYPSNAVDVSGQFTLKKEVFKTLSSYLTNHTSLSLASSITDVSGVTLDHLNAGLKIGEELVRFGNLTQDASGDDTLSFLNAMTDIVNDTEIFGNGANSFKTVIFIVKSTVTARSDSSDATGLNATQLTAIETIENRTVFYDEVGGSNDNQKYLGEYEQDVNIDGEWYAALCFKIA